MPAALGGAGAVPGPPGPQSRGPLLQERGTALDQHQVRQRDMRPHLHRLPGAFRQQPGGQQPPHGFLESVVVPLLVSAVIAGAGRGGQGVQDGLHELGALGGQVAVDDSGAAEGGGQAVRTVQRDKDSVPADRVRV